MLAPTSPSRGKLVAGPGADPRGAPPAALLRTAPALGKLLGGSALSRPSRSLASYGAATADQEHDQHGDDNDNQDSADNIPQFVFDRRGLRFRRRARDLHTRIGGPRRGLELGLFRGGVGHRHVTPVVERYVQVAHGAPRMER